MDLERGNELVQKITANIQQLNLNVQTLETYVDKIGGSEDTSALQENLNELVQNSNVRSKKTNTMMKELVSLSNEYRELRVHRERAQTTFVNVLNRLQSAQRNAAAKEKAKIQTVRYEDEKITRDQLFEDNQMRIQMQEQHRRHIDELKERNEALVQLESDINDVNQIFKDLARIVHDQGELVDSIEASVEHATIHVEQGHQNVQQALHYQQKARQKKMILLAFFVGLALVLALFFYLYSR